MHDCLTNNVDTRVQILLIKIRIVNLKQPLKREIPKQGVIAQWHLANVLKMVV